MQSPLELGGSFSYLFEIELTKINSPHRQIPSIVNHIHSAHSIRLSAADVVNVHEEVLFSTIESKKISQSVHQT
jgi:hypothetical protein